LNKYSKVSFARPYEVIYLNILGS